MDCFDLKSNEEYLDKTIISFSLYKLNKDEDVKKILLNNLENLYIHFEATLFYLNTHFVDEKEVTAWLTQILRNENILFYYFIALIFKILSES